MLNQSTHIKNFKKYPIWLLPDKSDSTAPMCTPLSKPKSGTFIMKEIWKKIEGFENYIISNNGRIYSLISRKILKLSTTHRGYYDVSFMKDNKRYHKVVSRLVAQSFIPNLLIFPQVNHKDGDKLNNNVNNLEWITNDNNRKHAKYITKKIIIKPIIATNIKTGEKIWFESACNARIVGFHSGSIWECCNKTKYHHTHKGYTWEYDTSNF